MGNRVLTLTVLVLAAFWGQFSSAETWTSLGGSVRLRDRPQINGKMVARIPARAHLNELEKRGYWIKVEYQGKVGWVPMAAVRVVVGVNESEIDIVHTHSKNLEGIYTHIFKIRNIGSVPFSGTVDLQGYYSGKIAFTETFSFRQEPIPAKGEREAIVEIKFDFTRFEYTYER